MLGEAVLTYTRKRIIYIEVITMIVFIIGLMLGGFAGVCVMAMMNMASYEDDMMEKFS